MSLLANLIAKSTAAAQPMARAYAEGNMLAMVKITRPSAPVFDRVTGGLAAMGADDTRYTGKARVYDITGPVQYAVGDEPQYFSSTFISIPLGAPKPRIDDVVEILSHPDPSVVGRLFRVQDVEGGGQIPVVHRMQVVGIQASREWEES